MKQVDEIKSDIKKFFIENYSVDVSEKIDKLDIVYTYSSDEFKGQKLAGFVDSEGKTVNISQEILTDEIKLNTVITHEMMHYIGIKPVNNSNAGMYCIEGLADSLAEECLEYSNKKFLGTPYYENARRLWNQIKVVDKEIIRNAVSKDNYDIMSNFDKRLKNVKCTFKKVPNISDNLENSINTVNQTNDEAEIFYLQLQSQDIVISYIKTFNPDKNQIKKIRENYLFEDYEEIVVKEKNGQYYLDY